MSSSLCAPEVQFAYFYQLLAFLFFAVALFQWVLIVEGDAGLADNGFELYLPHPWEVTSTNTTQACRNIVKNTILLSGVTVASFGLQCIVLIFSEEELRTKCTAWIGCIFGSLALMYSFLDKTTPSILMAVSAFFTLFFWRLWKRGYSSKRGRYRQPAGWMPAFWQQDGSQKLKNRHNEDIELGRIPKRRVLKRLKTQSDKKKWSEPISCPSVCVAITHGLLCRGAPIKTLPNLGNLWMLSFLLFAHFLNYAILALWQFRHLGVQLHDTFMTLYLATQNNNNNGATQNMQTSCPELVEPGIFNTSFYVVQAMNCLAAATLVTRRRYYLKFFLILVTILPANIMELVLYNTHAESIVEFDFIAAGYPPIWIMLIVSSWLVLYIVWRELPYPRDTKKTCCGSLGTDDDSWLGFQHGDLEKGVKKENISEDNTGSKTRRQNNDKLEVGDRVEANYKGTGQWEEGMIERDNGDGTYDIRYDETNGTKNRRHWAKEEFSPHRGMCQLDSYRYLLLGGCGIDSHPDSDDEDDDYGDDERPQQDGDSEDTSSTGTELGELAISSDKQSTSL